MKSKKLCGYFVLKGRCAKAYYKLNKKTKKYSKKKVDYKGRKLRKGTRCFKTKAKCMKYIREHKKIISPKRRKANKKVKKRKSKFGNTNTFLAAPYFGTGLPTNPKANWMWPEGKCIYENQQLKKMPF